MEDSDCNSFINELVSRYGNSAEISGSHESEFWQWLCPLLKDNGKLDCLMNSNRDDFYGAIRSVRENYSKKCKEL